MTPNKFYLIASFLEAYSEALGDRTCNDYSLPNTPENYQMMKDAEIWNAPDDPSEWEEPKIDKGEILTSDHFVVSYLAYLCRQEAEIAKSYQIDP